jgi:hypothetical protein
MRDHTDEMRMMRVLADMPPAIVQNEPRYQQFTSDGGHRVVLHQQDRPEARRMPIWHLDGVDWCDAPPPPRLHTHWAQTVGYLRIGEEIWRCPCGAYGERGGPWLRMGSAPRVAPWRWWWKR